MPVNAILEFRTALSAKAALFEVSLTEEEETRLRRYYELLLVWNDRLHLVAPCSATEFATRHVLESLQLIRHLRTGARIADVGSGAGLPIIPLLITRADLHAVLIESSHKKTVFLREALRATGTMDNAQVLNVRFESSPSPLVDYVSCRALDRFTDLLPELIRWAPPASTLLLFGGESVRNQLLASQASFIEFKIPDSDRRWLFVTESQPHEVSTTDTSE